MFLWPRVYLRTMVDNFAQHRPVWASKVHNCLTSYVKRHSVTLGRHQAWVSHPWLDTYFKYASVLGTHTFFILFLPLAYHIIGVKYGRILILTSALCVYITAMIKDFFCVERPVCPPARRVVIGSHHLEYGFPSTHSANSVGMCVAIYGFVKSFRAAAKLMLLFGIRNWLLGLICNTYILEGILLVYVVTITYGRIYLGMHTVLDCITGCIIGVAAAELSMAIDDQLDAFLRNSSFIVPSVIFAAGCFSLIIHPIPVGPCPCYEDVVCFVGAFVGTSIGYWRSNSYQEYDIDRLHKIVQRVQRFMPKAFLQEVTKFWKFSVQSSRCTRLVVCLIFGGLTRPISDAVIVPLLVWKSLATPVLKKLLPILYQRTAAFTKSFLSNQDKKPTSQDLLAEGKTSAREEASSSNVMRLRATTSMKQVDVPLVSEQPKQAVWEERMCHGMAM